MYHAWALAQLISARPLPEYATAGLMLLAAVLCFHRAQRRSRSGSSTRIWLAIAAALTLFAIVKATNALAVVGGALRDLARVEGVYNDRRTLQIAAIASVAAVAMTFIALAIYSPATRRYWLPITLTFLLGAFGLTRFVSLHALDAIFAQNPWIRTGGEAICTTAVAFLAFRSNAIGGAECSKEEQ